MCDRIADHDDKPYSINMRMPQEMRGEIELAKAFTGETATGFIKAAIVDRLILIHNWRVSGGRGWPHGPKRLIETLPDR